MNNDYWIQTLVDIIIRDANIPRKAAFIIAHGYILQLFYILLAECLGWKIVGNSHQAKCAGQEFCINISTRLP